ncbi:ACT domain-containing protein, partial [Enterococcus cecorum]
MRAILTVIGKDKVGIIAKVSQTLADLDLNII